MTLASTVSKKSTFQNVYHLKALGSRFDLMLSRSMSTYNYHLNKLGRTHIPNATYQVLMPSGFGEDFKRFFLLYMGVAAISVM